ncbi:acylphosphatase [Microbacterium sp. NPDC056234]|uniref:acylphosphatase n=1 Tax=Microbacterium sp. NPDC056234 TaxID=3345757 RepID=UPI0035DE4941
MTSVKVIVSGRVQGVGYRWFVHGLAAENGITGWVRNRRDGTVEAELHGDQVRIDRVVHAMRTGPCHARIEAIEVLELPEAAVEGFEIRATA